MKCVCGKEIPLTGKSDVDGAVSRLHETICRVHTAEVVEAHVSKTSNGGVGLYVLLRGPRDFIHSTRAGELAQRVATFAGWDANGPAHEGWPTQYGIGTLTKVFTFDHCACHHQYGCKEATKDVIWHETSPCGRESDQVEQARIAAFYASR